MPVDCESLGTVFPQQPVNTWSSLAFVAAAVVLWRRGHRLAATATLLAGIGSVLFHGAPSGVSSWIHDVGLYAAIAVAAVEVWRRVADGRFPVAATTVFAGGVAIWALSRTDGALCAPDSILQGHALWHGLAAAAIVLLFFARPGSQTNPSFDG